MKPDSLADAIPHTPASEYPPLPCRQCQSLTSRVMLSNHGGLCYRCYREYQRHGTTAVPNAFATYVRKGDSATVADMKTRVKPHVPTSRIGGEK